MVLFTTVTDATATGTSTDTASVDFVVPTSAKQLVKVAGYVTSTAPAVSQSLGGTFSLTGVDNTATPLEWISDPSGYSYLGTANTQGQLTTPKFKNFFALCKPNATWTLNYKPVDAVSGNGKFRCLMVWSSEVLNKLPRNSKVSTSFSSVDGTTNDLTISGMNRLLEAKTALFLAQPTVDESYISKETITSSSLNGVQQIELPLYSTAIEATGSCVYTPAVDAQLDIPVSPNKSNSVTFNIKNSVDTATSVAGVILTEITYLPSSIQR